MIKTQLQNDLKESLKSGDQLRRSVLGMLLASIKNRELIKRGQLSKLHSDNAELEQKSLLTDEEILETIATEVKKRKESIQQFVAGNRADLADKEKVEIECLMKYLPAQLDESEVRSEIKKAIAHTNAHDMKDMGKVIAEAMKTLKGKTDGSLVSSIVKEELSKPAA